MTGVEKCKICLQFLCKAAYRRADMYDETGPPDCFHRTCLPGDFCMVAVLTTMQKSARKQYAGRARAVAATMAALPVKCFHACVKVIRRMPGMAGARTCTVGLYRRLNMSERTGFQRTVLKQFQEYLSAGKRPGGQMFAVILSARAYTRVTTSPNCHSGTNPLSHLPQKKMREVM